jgi:[acyl-carrier-protein] S-malonyltransferase
MGKVAFVFPGQGAQKVGMGQAAHTDNAEARAVFDAADAALGEELSAMCFRGPAAELALTANTQPAVLTTSVALLRALGESPDVAAGHSLGEYSAQVCAKTLGFEDAVTIVRARGELMQDAVPVGQGAMAAVMGLADDVVERICAQVDGIVEPVNYNSPGQIVVAGSATGVESATGPLREAGAKVIALPVSAPFHSSLMRPAEDKLAPRLGAIAFCDPSIPVYVNVDASPVTSGEAARDALTRQVSRPVRWEQSVRRMLADGVTLFVEIGPGKVLSGLIGRITKEVQRINVQGPGDLGPAREAIAAARG